MNLKMIFAAGAIATLPLAAQAEMAPMAETELRAVQGQGPILDYSLFVIEELVDLGELDTFDDVLVDILAAFDTLIDPLEVDDVIDLNILPGLLGDSMEEKRTSVSELYAFRAELNEGVADLLPNFTVVGSAVDYKLASRAERFEFLGSLIAP